MAATAIAASSMATSDSSGAHFMLAPQPTKLAAAYAMFLIMEDVTKLVWGANPYYVSEPYSLFGNIDIGVQTYVGYDFALVTSSMIKNIA